MKSPYAVRRPVENVYLIRQRDRRRIRELLGVLVAVAVVGGGLLTYTWMHIEILRIAYQVDDLEKTLHRLEHEERRRRLAVSRSSQPSHIERRARLELGMAPPRLIQTLFAEDLGP